MKKAMFSLFAVSIFLNMPCYADDAKQIYNLIK